MLIISVIYTICANVFAPENAETTFNFGFALSLNTDQPWWINIYTTVFALPIMSVFVRRGHDIGLAGSKFVAGLFASCAAYILILKAFPTQAVLSALTVVLFVVLIAFIFIIGLSKSANRPNRFGPTPNEVLS